MKIDASNRVRFTVDGVRFAVSKNGVRVYQRDGIGELYDPQLDLRKPTLVLKHWDKVLTAANVLMQNRW